MSIDLPSSADISGELLPSVDLPGDLHTDLQGSLDGLPRPPVDLPDLLPGDIAEDVTGVDLPQAEYPLTDSPSHRYLQVI